jgi:polysaccharide export outer membrane protein
MKTMRSVPTNLSRVAIPLAAVLLSACAPKVPIMMAPLPDRPWTVLPGDQVRVRVYREPDLSGQYLVNGKGEVYVPGIGRILAAGMSADSLTQYITSAFSKRILDAVIDVGLVRSIPVLGQVKMPGVYDAEPSMSVQQLVAKSGGIRSASLETPTYLLRKGRDGTRYSLATDLRLDRIALDEGDAIVVVDPSFLEHYGPWIQTAAIFTGMLQIILTIFLLQKK